jgi:signal transduction histidine kinase
MHALERGGFDLHWERVDTADAMDAALKKRPWDLILADHSMPSFNAPAALELLKGNNLDLPFIIVSGHIDEETAVEAMRTGAHDYVMKDRLARLLPAVERELREAQVRRELRRAHEELELRVEKRTADLRAANLKLESLLEERKRLESELLEIAENERRRIGFDLHDDLGQKLTGISMMIKGLENKLGSEGNSCACEARKLYGLIEEAIHHTHDLAHNFSSIDVRGDDLTSMLKGLAANVKKMFEIPCGFGVKGSLPELPNYTTMQLYKIAQESVSNAIKHGKATEVSIGVAKNANGLILTIRNDGVPFCPPTQPTKRMGLRIMNYRANTIGANLQIEPLNGNGTVVTCELPIKNSVKPSRRRAEPCLV